EIPERVSVVRQIFALLEQGETFTEIAKILNNGRIPPQRPGKPWTRHAVGTIASFSAVVGTYIPHYQDYENGRFVRRPLKPIPNYYPSII
ncbi:recombinase family protein, partial [Acetobacter fabarum]|uniref:recombinase family protein n=1 Tax=Acetobacter fabarum TaxID=483199 RepID=UPI0033A4E6B5